MESCMSSYIILSEAFHKMQPSLGNAKPYQRMQCDICPPPPAKGANCLNLLKIETLYWTKLKLHVFSA